MKITPAIKGQLTKAYKLYGPHPDLFVVVRNIFLKHMPHEQAKHASKKYIAGIAK